MNERRMLALLGGWDLRPYSEDPVCAGEIILDVELRRYQRMFCLASFKTIVLFVLNVELRI